MGHTEESGVFGTRIKAGADLFLDLLFPPKCPFCGHLLEKGLLLCPDCQRSLPWLTGAAGEKAVELTGGCVAPLRYEGLVREGVHAFKFRGKRIRGETFGRLIARCVQDHGLTADLVSWPPLSPKRLRKRGYDQAQLLAEMVGKQLALPVARTLNKAERPAQSGLEEEGTRRSNLLGAYSACDPEGIRGKTILLVDDVVTTGATLSECAKTLRLAGAERILCATLARAR